MELRYTPEEMVRMLDETIAEMERDPEMKQHMESLYSHRALLTKPENLSLLIQLVMYLEDQKQKPVNLS